MPKIGVILAVDGENEFRQAMTNAKSATAATKAELEKLKQVYSDNANSLQALTAKQEALQNHSKNLASAVSAAGSGLKNAQKAVDQYKQSTQQMNNQLEQEKAKLDALRQTQDDSSEEVQEQAQAVGELTDALTKEEQKMSAAEKAVNQWKKKLADAEKAEDENNKALQKNEQYLEEAKNATDKCASSIDKFGNKTKDAAANTEAWGNRLKQAVANKAVSMGMDVVATGMNMAKDALVNGAKAAVEVGSNFEAAMSKVSALSGATGSTLDLMSKKAKQLGASTRFSATEVAEGFQYMALAGWDANTSLSAIDGVLQLAASAEMDLGQASDMVTDYLSAFGMEASKAGEMADMLAYAQANSNTSATQLGEAYGNCAAGLHSAGQEIDSVTALLEGMANNGLKGSEAGTALNAVMAQITQKMSDGAIQIGNTSVAVQDADGNFRDLIDIMADVESATEGMGSAERSAALAAVFNRTSLVGVNQILNEGTDKIKKYREELNHSKGAAQDMADTMNDNLQGDITTLNSALEGLGIAAYDAFGDKLRDGVQMATDLVSDFTDVITNTNTPLQDFIQNIDDGNRRVKVSLDGAKDAFSNAETDASKLQVYKDALLEVADATETTEFQKFQISQIVDELGGQIPELAAAWDEETGKLNLTAEAIENLMSAYEGASLQKAYVDALTQAQEALNEATIQRAMADSAVEQAEQDILKLGEDEKTLWKDGLSATQEYNDAVGDLVDTRRDALNEQSQAIEQEEEAQKQYEKTKAALEKLKKEHPELAELAEDVADAEEEAADGAQHLAAEITEISPEQLEELQKAADATKTSIEDAMKGAVSAFDEFNAGAEISKDDIIKNLDSQIEGLSNWSDNMARLAQEAGSGMSQELYDYLAEMGPQSANLVQTLVDTLDGDTDSFTEISQKWGEALQLSDNADAIAGATSKGKDLAAAMVTGLTEGAPDVQSATQLLCDTATQILDTSKGPMTAKGFEGVMAFTQGEENGTGNAKAAAGDMASSAAASAKDYSGFYSSGSYSASGLAAGIRSGRSGAVSAAIEIMRAAVRAAKSEAQIKSPSKKWEREVGLQLAKGAAKGLESGTPVVIASAGKMLKTVNASAKKLGEKSFTADFYGVEKFEIQGSGKNAKKVKKDVQTYYGDMFDAAESYMDKMQTLYEVSESAELTYWKNVQKHLKKGTNAWFDAQKKINELTKSIAEERAKQAEEQHKKAEEQVKADQEAIVERRKQTASVQDDILDGYKVYYKLSNKAESEYWAAARKKFKKGTQERIDADRKYYESRQAYLDDLQTLNQDYADRKKEIDEDLQEKTKDLMDSQEEQIKELNEAYSDAIKSRKQDILNSMNLFEAWDSTGYTADTLLHNLKTQTEGLKLWENEMNALRKKALPKEFVDQLEEMGPDATASIYSLNRMTSAQLDEYVKMWKEKNAIAQRQAEAENTDLLKERDDSIARVKKDTSEQLAAINAAADAELKALKEEYNKTFKEINTGASKELLKLAKNSNKTGEDAVAGLIAGLEAKEKKAKKKGKDIGKQVGEGIAAGIKSSIKEAEKAAEEIIGATEKKAKKKAKIKSPSALFRDEVGAQIAAGVALGIDQGTASVESSAKDMIDAAERAAMNPVDTFAWIDKGMAGIHALNALTEPKAGTTEGFDDSSIVSVLNTLVQLVGVISEKDQQIVLDSGALVGQLTPGVSREMAAASIRNTRGRLA